MMHYREANIDDIPQMMEIRFSVTENVLSNPRLVTAEDCTDYITRRGKGWIGEDASGQQIGFAIADLADHNIWALFVRPGYEGQHIGQQLQTLMLEWYFQQTSATVWLGTGPGTRAETFYRRTGWHETGRRTNGEIRFEMTAAQWRAMQPTST